MEYSATTAPAPAIQPTSSHVPNRRGSATAAAAGTSSASTVSQIVEIDQYHSAPRLRIRRSTTSSATVPATPSKTISWDDRVLSAWMWRWTSPDRASATPATQPAASRTTWAPTSTPKPASYPPDSRSGSVSSCTSARVDAAATPSSIPGPANRAVARRSVPIPAPSPKTAVRAIPSAKVSWSLIRFELHWKGRSNPKPISTAPATASQPATWNAHSSAAGGAAVEGAAVAAAVRDSPCAAGAGGCAAASVPAGAAEAGAALGGSATRPVGAAVAVARVVVAATFGAGGGSAINSDWAGSAAGWGAAGSPAAAAARAAAAVAAVARLSSSARRSRVSLAAR